jgi:hypothetical protein
LAIFEPVLVKEILNVTCSILRTNFYYEDESLDDFVKIFTNDISTELLFFEANAHPETLDKLHEDNKARLYFTCYFVSAHLRDIFINKLHFTEQEIYAFENILPKYTGESRRYETKSEYKRAHHRKFFE